MTRYIMPILFSLFLAGATYYVKERRASTPVAAQDARAATIAYQPTNDRQAWAYDLATRLGNAQPSADTVALIVAWTEAEDRSAGAVERFNPLNTTETIAAQMVINSDGVKGYARYEDGMAATVQTLGYDYPGYAEIVAGLQSNDPARALAGMYASPWGTDMRTVESIWQSERGHAPQASATGTCVDPVPDWRNHINVGFYAINCDAWGMQSGCQHYGTDIGGQGEGTPVQAPCSGTYTGCVDNGDSGPYIGKWIEYTADGGAQFLINHFRDSPFCGAPVGTRIEVGALLGTMRGDANHIHIQTKVNGQLVDFEEYWRTHQ